MKYRTMIELICDASDKEDAVNIAGDYLKGDIDFGVTMRCKAMSLRAHRVKKCVATCLFAGVIFSAMILKVTLLGGEEKLQNTSQVRFHNTYTIMPALKTKHRSGFKKEWERKKDEVILQYLKK